MRTGIKNVIAAVAGVVSLTLVASCLVLPAWGGEPAAPAPRADVPQAAAPAAIPAAPAAGAAGRTLTELVVAPDGIDLVISGGTVETFTAYPLTKPDRFVIDLPGVRGGLGAGAITLGAFGIESARLVEVEGKSRLVFEGKDGRVRQTKVIRTDRGLRLQPAPPGAAPAPARTAAEPPQEAVSHAAHDPSVAAVQSLDFAVVETGSRITMTVGGKCAATKPHKDADGVWFFVKKCSIPRNLRRIVDTSAFPSAVQSVHAYQVTVKGVPETRVLVKLNQPATWSLNQEGGTITLDIFHEKQEQKADRLASPALISGAQAEPSPAAQPQPQPESLAQVVTLPSPAPPPSDATVKRIQDAASAPPGAKKVYTGRKVTLEFVDADIRKIFQLIAEVSNLNILLGDDVTGTITIKLINVPWDQALDVILDSRGLGMRADGNIVLIKPKSKFKSADEEALEAKKSREKMLDLYTRVFDVNFAQASDVVAQFRSLGSGRSDSSITLDERTNKVIVTDIEAAVTRMKRFLDSIDVPERQVLIEARIVEATTNFTQDLGIAWGIHYRDPSASFLGINTLHSGFGGVVTPPNVTGTYGPGMATGISFGTLASTVNVDLRLSAAVITEKVKIISTPKVVTLNNKPAKITQGQMIPYQNTTANTGAVTQFVEAALSLEVTPHITPDGSVMMKIKASNNSATAIGNPPAINKKEATTELLVKNGETTVIGGIYQDSDTDGDNGVPYLKDIPLFGWLFKSNSTKKSKTELLIFITPRVVS